MTRIGTLMDRVFSPLVRLIVEAITAGAAGAATAASAGAAAGQPASKEQIGAAASAAAATYVTGRLMDRLNLRRGKPKLTVPPPMP